MSDNSGMQEQVTSQSSIPAPTGVPAPSPASTPSAQPGPAPDARYAGLQSFYDKTLAGAGYRNVQEIPHAEQVRQAQEAAAQVPALRTDLEAAQAQAAQLQAQVQQEQQKALAALGYAQKLSVLAQVDPRLTAMADAIVVPQGATEEQIRQAAIEFKDRIASVFGASAAPSPAAPAAPPPPAAVGAGAPPAGQAANIDQQLAAAQGKMWDAAGKDEAAYTAATQEYFRLINEKQRLGWTDYWGKPQGYDRPE